MTSSKLVLLASIFSLGAIVSSDAAVPFTDNFNTAHNYFSSGVSGTGWDGILNSGNLEAASAATGGILTWQTAVDTKWDTGASSAALLYLSVTGDFSASVQITGVNGGAFNNAALMALNPSDIGDWAYLDGHFNDNNVFFNAVNGTVPGSGNPSISPKGGYVRLDRVGNVFTAYSKVNSGDSWRLIGSADRSADIGSTVYLGLTASGYGGGATTATFSNFNVVPEPGSALLIASGFGVMGLIRRRRA